MRVLLILLAALYVQGCELLRELPGSPEPYAEVGVGYQLDDMTDWYRQTSRGWECSQNWKATIEAGLDWGHCRVGYHHQSWWLCGGPFYDERPETYADDIRGTCRFGGK